MKKIRINELARELEVKAHELLEKLPELGVTEKKTHSSSIDDDVAEKLRRIFKGGADAGERPAPADSNGAQAVALEEPGTEPTEEPEAEAPALAAARETHEAVEEKLPRVAPQTQRLRPPLAGS